MSNLNTWKDKYLDALDEQEKLENRVSEQAELLKRVVSQLSALASGQDPKIDAALLALKDKLRNGVDTAVQDHMSVVETLARQEDARRISQHTGFSSALTTLLSHLDVLRLPQVVQGELKDIKAILAKEIQDYSAYLQLLHTVNLCHQRALQAATAPDQSLWQRLSGKKRLQSDLNAVDEGDAEGQLTSNITENQSPIEAKPAVDSQAHIEAKVPSSPPMMSALREQLDEPTYDEQRLAIRSALKAVLQNIYPGESVKPYYHRAQARLEQETMDWYQVLETVEDLRDVLMGSTQGREEAFSVYLLSVNQQLQEMCAVLGVTIEHNEQNQAISDALGQSVSDQMAWMRDAMESSVDLDQLKDDVSKHLHIISDALQRFREEQSAVEPLSEQLVALLERMKSVEQESLKTKILLEKERHKATHDALTELPNRQAYEDRSKLEFQRFKRYGHPLSLAVCDVDHFKKFNDTYGHQTGDRVLKLVAKALNQDLRTVDFIARYGGEEFVILLPETSGENALLAIEKTRKRLANAAFRFKKEPVHITVSFGVAEFMADDTLDSAFHRADQALYAAKQAGRNRAQFHK